MAWGYNDYGQSTVPGLGGVAGIAAGGYHSLALKSDGTVVAWGYNESGQSTVPTGLGGVVGIAAGSLHSLALKSDGTVVAWGHNYYGQSTVPTGLGGVVSIVAGGGHSLALKSDGTVMAWGDNNYDANTVPTGLGGVVSIAAGGGHSLAIVAPAVAPSILVQPQSLALSAGQNASFTVTATGTAPLSYQWRKDGLELAGQNTTGLALTNVIRAQSGLYAVIVSNAVGTVTSSNALLRVLVPQRFDTNSVRRLPDGRFRLVFGDYDNNPLDATNLVNFEVHATTNFVNWLSLTNGFTLTNGQVQVDDPGSISLPRRFYRVIEK